MKLKIISQKDASRSAENRDMIALVTTGFPHMISTYYVIRRPWYDSESEPISEAIDQTISDAPNTY